MPNSRHESNERFYDRISHVYDLIADAGEHQARELGEQLLAPQPGERILEIGYGTGNTIVSLARAVAPAGRVVGVDISAGMRDVAARKVSDAGLPGVIRLDLGDARRLPYEDGQFDAAFLSFTLELFAAEEIPMVLGELHRVLRPGGRVAVVSMSEVAPGESPSLLERTYVWMHRHFPHIVDCRPIDVERRLREAGFEIRASQHLEIWTMPVAAVVGVRGEE